mgnify:CR=1 FL=1
MFLFEQFVYDGMCFGVVVHMLLGNFRVHSLLNHFYILLEFQVVINIRGYFRVRMHCCSVVSSAEIYANRWIREFKLFSQQVHNDLSWK